MKSFWSKHEGAYIAAIRGVYVRLYLDDATWGVSPAWAVTVDGSNKILHRATKLVDAKEWAENNVGAEWHMPSRNSEDEYVGRRRTR